MNNSMPEHINRLTDCILDEMHDLSDRQISFFGHSEGLIAYDLALRMENVWDKSAQALFISSCRVPSQLLKSATCLNLTRIVSGSSQLLEELELRKLFLPTLRHDVALCEGEMIEAWRNLSRDGDVRFYPYGETISTISETREA